MNVEETTRLCKAIAALAPAQRFDDETPAIWSVVLAGTRYADAREAIVTLAQRQRYIAPADIIEAVKALRAKRLEGVDRLAHLAETPEQWRQIIAEVADGERPVPPLELEDPTARRAIEAKVHNLFPRPPKPLPAQREEKARAIVPATVDAAAGEDLEAERARQLAALEAIAEPADTREDQPA